MKLTFTTFLFTFFLLTFCQAQDWADLGHFREDNAKFDMPAKTEKRIVLMGNSITEGWGTMRPGFFAEKPFINRGISGQTTPQMLVRFRADVVDLKPSVVVILAGINDIAGNTGVSTIGMIVDNIKSMAEIAKANGIKVVLSAVLPALDFPWRPGMDPAMKVVELNGRIKSYAEQNGYVYLDYFQAMVDDQNGLKAEYTYDGVHPNIRGYEVMEPLLEAAIAKALKQKSKSKKH